MVAEEASAAFLKDVRKVPRLLPGVTEGLRLLRDVGAIVFVVTEGDRHRVEETAKVLGIHDYPNRIHTVLSGDAMRSVNEQTLATLKLAVFVDTLHAMRYARMELSGTQYAGQSRRDYRPSVGTSWLTYVTFHYKPQVPSELEAFLADAHNRQQISVEYLAHRDRFVSVVKIPLPLSGTYASLLDIEADEWLSEQRLAVAELVGQAKAEDAYAEIERWRHSLDRMPVSGLVLERFDAFISEAAFAAHRLSLRP